MGGDAWWWVADKAASYSIFRGGGREKQRVPRRCSLGARDCHCGDKDEEGPAARKTKCILRIYTFHQRAGLGHFCRPAHRRVPGAEIQLRLMLRNT